MLIWLLGALGLTAGGIGVAALLGGGPAMLLGLKWLWSWLSHATFLQVVCVALVGAFAVDHLALLASHRHSRKVEAQLSKTTAAYAQTVANYRAAALRAQQEDAANKARAENEQAAISGRIANDYQDRVAAARAEYQRLLANATAHFGVRAGTNVPVIPASPGSPPQASGKDGLSDALTATEQAIQLDELIKWVKQQHQVDPNGKQ